jgi:hypothetical protein
VGDLTPWEADESDRAGGPRGRAAAAVAAVVAVLVVGLLARSPATEADLVVPTSEPVAPTAAPDADPTTADRPPTGVVLALDPATLQEVAAPLVGLASPPVVASATTPAALVDAGGRLFELDPPGRTDGDGLPAGARSSGAEPAGDLTWLGTAGGTVAWARADGVVRVQAPGAPAANRTLRLPPGLVVRDARLLDADTMAAVADGDLGEPPMLLVIDLSDGGLSTRRSIASGVRPGEPGVALAWDLPAGRVWAADPGRRRLLRVDLPSGLLRPADLPPPAPSGAPVADAPDAPAAELRRRASGLVVDALGRRAVVGGEDLLRLPGGRGDLVRQPIGLALYDEELRLLDHRPDVPAVHVAIGRDLVLAADPGEGLAVVGGVRDGDLEVIDRLLAGRRVLELRRGGPAGDVAYAVTCPAADTACADARDAWDPSLPDRELTAVDTLTWVVTGTRPLTADDVGFVPSATLLLRDG